MLSGSSRVPGSVFDAIFEHVVDPPATPVDGNREEVVKWLEQHVRVPLDMYFAYGDASVQEIKDCARAAGFTGNTAQAPLLTYMPIKSRMQGIALKLDTQGHQGQRKGGIGCDWDAAFLALGAL